MATNTLPNNNRYMIQPQIILLKEGVDHSQGLPQLLSNIKACLSISEILRSTLGPFGMDKLLIDDNKTIISNDGATILKTMQIIHPCCRILTDIAMAQDSEVGDGTTSVVLMTCEILKMCLSYIQDKVSVNTIIKSIRKCALECTNIIDKLKTNIEYNNNNEEFRNMLIRVAKTALSSKLINTNSSYFAEMSVEAVLITNSSNNQTNIENEYNNKSIIGIKKVTGGSMLDSFLIKGVAFKKTFSYAGFEQQPKKIKGAKIICLNVELELKAERDNAEIRVNKVDKYNEIVNAEWQIIFDKLDNIVKTNANVVLSKLPIGDLATQYFADRKIFCAGRVSSDDLERVINAAGGEIYSSCTNLGPEASLGYCETFEERQIGNERYNVFTGCPNTKTCTIVLRGGALQFIEEVERSIHDAIMVVRRALKYRSVVPGAGAIEMELSRHIREYAKTISGKQQLIASAFAKALEVIPRQLCLNAGFDPTLVMAQLRYKHNTNNDDSEGKNYGVDILKEAIINAFEAHIWEPAILKSNVIMSAVEAACLILSVDETIKDNTNNNKP